MTPPLSADECRAFLEAQGFDVTGDTLPSDDAAGALADAIDTAVTAWPDFVPDRVGFATYLGKRVPSDIGVREALRGRVLGELYLAFACLAGNPAAVAHLDTNYLQPLVPLIARQGIAPDIAAETVQQLRMQLLTGERPILRAYSGVGALKGWLRITALREAVRAQRKARARDGDEVSTALADAAADQGLQYQRRLYQEEFRTAFGGAVASLTVRERNLLKPSVLYGATVDDLGALYHVHRATASRWLVAARARLAEVTRQRMIEQLKIQPAEYESILQLIQSQLDVSVARVLG